MMERMNRKYSFKHAVGFTAIVLVASAALTGCLKTRSQIRGESDDEYAPQANEVKDITPQGGYIIEEMKSEITRLTGRLEDLERAQKDAAKDANLKDELKKLEDRMIELENAQAQILTELKKSSNSSSTGAEQKSLFDEGKTLYLAKKYDESIDKFSEYLKAAKGQHFEEATFLRAEAYFETKQYKKAIIDYSRFPEKYTKSRRMPAVLFKIGQSFDALSMKDDAKGFYQEVVEKFPKSSEALKAKKRLK